MLPRILRACAGTLRKGYPAIAITGPRQSGKTTFVQQAFPDLPYVNLESPIERDTFNADPVGFFDRFHDGAALDEVQNLPSLLSYLQVRIDEQRRMGRWVLTGSQQITVGRGAAQSLAGRVALLELLPFAHAELAASSRQPSDFTTAVFVGGYPPLFDPSRELNPARWLEDYVATFVNRDVPQILGVRDRPAFDRFLRLCAGRTGQMLNAAELGRDVGIDHKTVDAWIGVLEACHLVRILRPHYRSFGKRLVKRPKLYFVDSGLACRLLHISSPEQLRYHPLWGPLAETWCFSEILKCRLNRGLQPNLWYWRSSDGVEVDVVIEAGTRLFPIEIKATATPHPDHAGAIRKMRELSRRDATATVPGGLVIYAGTESRPAGEDRFVPWNQIEQALATLA